MVGAECLVDVDANLSVAGILRHHIHEAIPMRVDILEVYDGSKEGLVPLHGIRLAGFGRRACLREHLLKLELRLSCRVLKVHEQVIVEVGGPHKDQQAAEDRRD